MAASSSAISDYRLVPVASMTLNNLHPKLWQVLLYPTHDPQWVDFEYEANDIMELAWMLHTAADTPHISHNVWYKRSSFSFHGETWYEADLNAFTQTNWHTRRTRSIRRMEMALLCEPSIGIKWQQQTSPNAWRDIPNDIAHTVETAFLNDHNGVRIDFQMDTHSRFLDFNDFTIKRYVVVNRADGTTTSHACQLKARRIKLSAP
jgi:hypothetical protein